MVKNRIIRLAAMLLAAVLLIGCLNGCSKKGNRAYSLFDLKEAMAAATNQFGEMKYASSADDDPEEVFKNISDMPYDKVAGFFVYYAADGTGNADEITVIQVKNKKDIALAKAALEAHIERRKALYATYDKTQLTKLDGYEIMVSGTTAGVVVAKDAQRISSAFYQFFNSNGAK